MATKPAGPIPNSLDPAVAEAEALTKFLIENPDFDDMPVTIERFLGPGYLNIDRDQNPDLPARGAVIRAGVKQALIDIFGTKINPESISEKREALFSGGIGIGKFFEPYVQVSTPTGWRNHGDLQVGDYVTGSNGRATEVVGVYPRSAIRQYRVHFKDGTSIQCGEDHLWAVDERKSVGVKQPDGKYKTKAMRERSVMSTEQLAATDLQVGKDGHQSYRYSIPLVEPVRYSVKFRKTVDPYTLGLMLANGSMHSGTPKLACHTRDRDELLELIDVPGVAASWSSHKGVQGGSLVLRSDTGESARRKWSNPFAKALNDLGLHGVQARDKFIPENYKLAPPKARLELLRGLMDGDGTAQASGNRQNFSTSSQRLADDVASLVRSLGGYCTVTSFERNGADEIQVHVNMGDVCPFKLSRKVKGWKPRTGQPPRRSIVKVEDLGFTSDGHCIKVAAEDSLYVVQDFIVTHNTTMASVALAYMVHWVSCLHDPQTYFGLMPGSRIAFMLMSTKDSQAKEVLFGDIKARINYSPWFRENCVYDPNFKNQLRFPKDIWVIPGNSMETTFEGYNILGGILDEGDSHKVTENKDYAEVGWRTITARVASRFTDPISGKHRGLLIAIGQMKSAKGFMSRTKARMEKDEDAKVVFMPIWESMGWDYYRDPATGETPVFFYDVDRRIIVPDAAAKLVNSPRILRIPMSYKKDFDLNPVQALKDHAGIPPNVDDPFVATPDRVEDAQVKWEQRYPDLLAPVSTSTISPTFDPEFRAHDSLRRSIHVDIAYASGGDALGMAMGHIPEMVEINGELKPVIVIDFLLRIKPRGGQQLMLSDFRRTIVELRDERKFKISLVTFDGFQSMDSMQILRHQKKFNTDELSVDRTKGPYEELREAIYERRIEFPRYLTYMNHNDTDVVDIGVKELLELQDTGRKIDHPHGGSKDVTDAMAGVVYALMGNYTFQRGARRPRMGTGTYDSRDVITTFGATTAVEQLDASALGQGMVDLADLNSTAASHGLPPLQGRQSLYQIVQRELSQR